MGWGDAADNPSDFQPLVLGAVPIKSEIIEHVQREANLNSLFKVVMSQWAALCHAVSFADEVCVVGYSFPPEDAYGHFLLREAARRRTRPWRRVDLYEVRERFNEVRTRIAEVFGVSPEDVADRGPVSAPEMLRSQ